MDTARAVLARRLCVTMNGSSGATGLGFADGIHWRSDISTCSGSLVYLAVVAAAAVTPIDASC